MKLEDRIIRSLTQRAATVILRSELAKLGSSAQVGRVLARLVDEGKLVRVSKGAFAKTRVNKFTGKPTAAGTLEDIAAELFQKLGIAVSPSQLAEEYNSSRSTQIPMGSVV